MSTPDEAAHERPINEQSPLIGPHDWARSVSKGWSLQSWRLKSKRTALAISLES